MKRRSSFILLVIPGEGVRQLFSSEQSTHLSNMGEIKITLPKTCFYVHRVSLAAQIQKNTKNKYSFSPL